MNKISNRNRNSTITPGGILTSKLGYGVHFLMSSGVLCWVLSRKQERVTEE